MLQTQRYNIYLIFSLVSYDRDRCFRLLPWREHIAERKIINIHNNTSGYRATCLRPRYLTIFSTAFLAKFSDLRKSRSKKECATAFITSFWLLSWQHSSNNKFVWLHSWREPFLSLLALSLCWDTHSTHIRSWNALMHFLACQHAFCSRLPTFITTIV